MYRIMFIKSKMPDGGSQYQFMTKTEEGHTSILEIETEQELAEYIGNMLMNGYAKNEFSVVKVIDYDISIGPFYEVEPEENDNP